MSFEHDNRAQLKREKMNKQVREYPSDYMSAEEIMNRKDSTKKFFHHYNKTNNKRYVIQCEFYNKDGEEYCKETLCDYPTKKTYSPLGQNHKHRENSTKNVTLREINRALHGCVVQTFVK